MNIIEPKVELIKPEGYDLNSIYKMIEIGGRTCYRSNDRITEDSAKKFVEMIKTNNHCYTGDSEVLTDKGWIKWSQYHDQKVAVVNKDLSFKGFESPKKIIRYEYNGIFYNYPVLGLKVTQGHKMLGVFRDSHNDFYNNNNYSLFRCDTDYIDNNGRHKTLGQRMFKSPTCCKTPEETNPFFELLGFWLGDGQHTTTSPNKLYFHLKKQRKIKYLRELCLKLKYEFESLKNDSYTVTCIGIGTLFNANYYKNGEKYINDQLDPISTYSVFRGLLESDGSIEGDNRYRFCTTSVFIMNWIENNASIVGYDITIKKQFNQYPHKDSYNIWFKSSKYKLNNDSRNVNTKVIITKEKLDVYCVTVSTGLIIVRGSNKQVSICGNCSVFEHGTVYLKMVHETPVIEDCYYTQHYYTAKKYKENPYSVVNNISHNATTISFYITTNMRVIIENGWEDDLQYLCEPTKYHEKRYTFRFTTQIAITREANRHRVNSISEQSTRYCNYSKDKFNRSISINLPTFIDADKIESRSITEMCEDIATWNTANWSPIDYWMFANIATEFSYMNLIGLGWKPQQARVVLPLDTNSEVVYTAFERDWKHFIELRTSTAAHPDIRILAEEIKKEIYN